MEKGNEEFAKLAKKNKMTCYRYIENNSQGTSVDKQIIFSKMHKGYLNTFESLTHSVTSLEFFWGENIEKRNTI